MLLYVDKKKERRRKIKIIGAVLFCLFVLIANWVGFFQTLQHADGEILSSYHQTQPLGDWFEKTTAVNWLSAKDKNAPVVVIVPNNFTQENALTTAAVFAHLPKKIERVLFIGDVAEKAFWLELLNVFYPDISETAEGKTLYVASKLEDVTDIVMQNRLLPRATGFKSYKKYEKEAQVFKIVEQEFPAPTLSTDELSKEVRLLDSFVKSYHQDLRNVLVSEASPSFETRHFLLQNADVCLKSAKQKYCVLNPQQSLMSNLQQAVGSFYRKEKPISLVILTKRLEISEGEPIDKNEGVLFRFEERESLLLSEEINKLKENTYDYLKRAAGINTGYHSDKMKFYKFKTVEMRLDDKI